MIRVTGTVESAAPEIEVDPWIPLKVSWTHRPKKQPLYLRVSGSTGGELELKIDPDTGALFQLIIIDEPPLIDEIIIAMNDVPGDFVPLLDTSLWQWTENPGYRAPRAVVASVTAPLKVARFSDRIVLHLSDLQPSTHIASGKVQFGLSNDGLLSEIRVAVPRS